MINRQILRDSWHSWIRSDSQKAGPAWLQLLWTFIFSSTLALIFTLIGFATHARTLDAWLNARNWFDWFGANEFVSLCVGYTIHALFSITRRLFGAKRILQLQGWKRVAYFAGVPLVGLYAAWPLSVWILSGRFGLHTGIDGNLVIGSVIFSVIVTFVIYQFFSAYNRRLDAERRAVEGRLKLLQSQIEPHFLFNTLANVVSLIDHEPPRARLMLEEFIGYLRATLAGTRRERATLGDELALVEHYLKLLRIRMDDRLAFEIDVPAELHGTLLPPLSLQPLVENAVVHGLEPKVTGGRVVVSARRAGEQVWIEVRDDGMGLAGMGLDGRAQDASSSGIGTRNTRERIVNMFGPAAGLDIEAGNPGVVARIRIPFIPAQESCA
jgi:hypothetical protein